MTGSNPGRAPWIRFLAGWPAAAAILAIFWLLMLASLREKSLTTDEAVHATAGYSYWHFNDYRLNPENGNLPQRIMALPLWLGPYRFPAQGLEAWRTADEWLLGDIWFYQMGNDATGMLRRGRAASGLLAVALGALVWGWSRRLFGAWGGMLSLLLFVLSPTVLANGALMTSDTACALFFLAATSALWRMLERLSPGRVLASALLVGCLFLSKMSAVLILPIAAILALARLLEGRPLPAEWGSWRRDLARRGERSLALLASGLVHVLVVTAVIWASFGFRYSIFADGQARPAQLRDPWDHVLGLPQPVEVLDRLDLQPDQRRAIQRILVRDGVRSDGWTREATAAIGEIRGTVLDPAQIRRLDAARTAPPPAAMARLFDFIRRHRLLPEAYVYGYAASWKYSQSRGAFLNGKFSLHGWKSFFPYTFLVKTPLPVFGLILLAAAAGAGRGRGAGPPPRRWSLRGAYATLPLWTLLAVYWAAVIPSHVDIGHRHIFAVYPPLFVLCGAAGAWAERARTRAPAALVASLVLLLGAEVAYRFPNYLAYFNFLDGGPARAYRHLVDSSLDWGQDLPGVRTYVEAHRVTGPVYLAYFGSGSPDYYHIPAQSLYPRTQLLIFISFPANREDSLREKILRDHPDYDLMAAEVRDGVETVALLKKPSAIELEGGTYFISATLLQPLERNSPGPWGPWNAGYEATYRRLAAEIKPIAGGTPADRRRAFAGRPAADWMLTLDTFDIFRFARLTAFLRQREPDDTVNFSILVYRLTDADIVRALAGPSPALERNPLHQNSR